MSIPTIMDAVVTAIVPDSYSVIVTLIGVSGGQIPFIPARVLTAGPRDAVRGHFPELPLPGQHGLVAVTRDDLRNCRWIGSNEPALNDASPYAPGQYGIGYTARHSGGWEWHGPDGTAAMVLADGTSFLAGGSLPKPTRHTVDGDQQRQTKEFTQADRVPSPPASLPLALAHKSGARASLTGAGAGTLSIPSGQGLNISVGSTTISVAAGGTATIKVGGSTITVTAGGVTIQAAGITLDGQVTVNGDLTATGAIQAGSGGGDAVTVQHHIHPSNGSPPTPGS